MGQLSIGGFTVQHPAPGAMPIDVLTRDDVWLDVALTHPEYDNAGYPVIGRSYLTLVKLQSGRIQDLADVQRLLAHTPQAERDSTRRLVEQYSPDLVEDYDALSALADLEFGPPPDELRA